MAVSIIMPKLGMAMKEGVVAKWNKQDGDQVEEGEEVAVVMSKKITYKLKAPEAGILRIVAQEKQTLPVGAAIGFVTAPGEALPEVPEVAAPAAAVSAAAPSDGGPAPPPSRPKGAFVPASPAARRLAQENNIDLVDVPATGPDGMVTEGDVESYLETLQQAPPPPEVLATSAARALAGAKGVDLRQVRGSGVGGRVTEADVQAFLAGAAVPASPVTPVTRIIPFAGMRLAIAENMVHSLQSMAQVTLTTEVDATELVKLRTQLKQDFDLTYTDLLVKAVAKTLKVHPRLNATLIGDEIHLLEAIHVGIAVALAEGLIVPVLRDADKKSVEEIARETRRLAQEARDETLSVDDAAGSTFTITNLGAQGIDAFTPIVNPPETAILGVGRIVEKPVIYDDEFARRFMMVLSLTIDHRLVDGAPGAHFLNALRELLESPYRLLI